MATKSKPAKAPPKIEDVFELAMNFEAATLALTHTCAARMDAVPNGVSVYIPENRPRVVNSAFSFELYLKCLLLIDKGSWPKWHNLLDLFNQLPPRLQKRITELYDVEFDLAPDSPLLLQHTKNNDRAAYSIQNVLRNSGAAFEEWRYAFEGIPTSIGYGAQLVRIATRRAILEVRPDLKTVAIKHKIGDGFANR